MGLKYNKALEWGIPVVSNDWLEAIASSGAIPPPSEDSIDRKGKGRAKEGRERAQSVVGDAMQVDKHMHDITNSEFPRCIAFENVRLIPQAHLQILK